MEQDCSGDMGTESGRFCVAKNKIENNGLRLKLTKIKGEREDKLFDIRRKETYLLTKRRSFRECKKDSTGRHIVCGDTKGHSVESDRQKIQQGVKHSVRELQSNLRRSRTEHCLPCLPALPSYNQRMQTLQGSLHFTNELTSDEFALNDTDDETEKDFHRGSHPRCYSDSVKYFSLRSPLSEKLKKRVASEETMDYLLRDVFERLYSGIRNKRKTTEDHIDGDYESLRSCRYLRLPHLKQT